MNTLIFGATNESQVASIINFGADFLSLNPDTFSTSSIKNLIHQYQQHILITLYSSQITVLEAAIKEIGCQFVHVGAHPDKFSASDFQKLKLRFPQVRFAQVIPVIDRYSIEIAKRYEALADFLFLDSFNFSAGQLGVTGMTHDWNISAEIIKSMSIPVILAGGLGPENVAKAISITHPWGVATKTRTDLFDKTGKDLEKVKEFLSQSRLSN